MTENKLLVKKAFRKVNKLWLSAVNIMPFVLCKCSTISTSNCNDDDDYNITTNSNNNNAYNRNERETTLFNLFDSCYCSIFLLSFIIIIVVVAAFILQSHSVFRTRTSYYFYYCFCLFNEYQIKCSRSEWRCIGFIIKFFPFSVCMNKNERESTFESMPTIQSFSLTRGGNFHF